MWQDYLLMLLAVVYMLTIYLVLERLIRSLANANDSLHRQGWAKNLQERSKDFTKNTKPKPSPASRKPPCKTPESNTDFSPTASRESRKVSSQMSKTNLKKEPSNLTNLVIAEKRPRH